MKDEAVHVADVLQRIRRIERATEGGRADFQDSELVQDAVMRSFEIM